MDKWRLAELGAAIGGVLMLALYWSLAPDPAKFSSFMLATVIAGGVYSLIVGWIMRDAKKDKKD